MLLNIHNLPSHMQYADVKQLLQTKCGLTELIYDKLIREGDSKVVTVGVQDEGDAAIIVRKINGLYMDGKQLFVEDKRKKSESDQPYRSVVPTKPNANEQRFGSYQTADTQNYGGSNNQGFGGTSNQKIGASNYQWYGATDNQRVSTNNVATSANQMYGATVQGYPAPVPPVSTNIPPLFAQWPMAGPYQAQNQYNVGYPSIYQTGWGNNQPNRTATSETRSQPETWGESGKDKRMNQNVQGKTPQPLMLQDTSSFPRDYEGNTNSGYGRYQQRPENGSTYGGERGLSNRSDKTPQPLMRQDTSSFSRNYDGNTNQGYGGYQQRRESSYGGERGLSNRSDSRFESNRNSEWGPSSGNHSNRTIRWDPQSSNAQGGPSSRDGSSARGGASMRGGSNYRDGPNNRGGPSKRGGPSSRGGPNNRGGSSNRGGLNKWGKPRVEYRRPDLRSQLIPIEKKKKKGSNAQSVTKMNNKEDSFRGQSTSLIAKEMLQNVGEEISTGEMKALKVAVRKRVDLLMGCDYHESVEQIVAGYRKKYIEAGDKGFFKSVMIEYKKKLEAEIAEGEPTTGTAGAPSNADSGDTNAKEEGSLKRPREELPVDGQDDNLKKLKPSDELESTNGNNEDTPIGAQSSDVSQYQKPNVSANDKKKVLKYKKPKTLAVPDEPLDPMTDKALNLEFSALLEVIKGSLDQPADDSDTILYNFLNDSSETAEFAATLKQIIINRIQRETTHLVMRAHWHGGKKPKKAALAKFLEDFDVMRLKRSVKSFFFVLTFRSYEGYDRLYEIGSTMIDGVKVDFRPMSFIPSSKLSKAQYRKAKSQFVQQQLKACSRYVKELDPNRGPELGSNRGPKSVSNMEPESVSNMEPELVSDDISFKEEEEDAEVIDEPQEVVKTVNEIPENLLNLNEDELEDY